MTTVINATYHHMPEWTTYNAVERGWNSCAAAEEGNTVRKALFHLREVGRQGFGDIGGCTLYLSDGSFIAVENRATEGGVRMCTQRIVRYDKDFHQKRGYSWT